MPYNGIMSRLLAFVLFLQDHTIAAADVLLNSKSHFLQKPVWIQMTQIKENIIMYNFMYSQFEFDLPTWLYIVTEKLTHYVAF